MNSSRWIPGHTDGAGHRQSRTGAHGSRNVTLFAFDVGEELSEHTAPFDALALTLSGSLVLAIGGRDVRTAPQTIVLMPANVPHAVHATEASRMLLIMLRGAPCYCSSSRGLPS